MMRSFYLNNKIYLITIMIIVIFASCISTYYITTKGEVYNNYRLKRIEESQNQTCDLYGNTNTVNPRILSPDSVTIQALDELTQLIHSHQIISFFMMAAILSFLQLYLQIRRRNILISQTGVKIFLVHYLQLKDGKKSAPSFNI